MSINIDHKGKEFRDQCTMCKHYGVRVATFSHRIRTGWSLEDALTKEVVPQHVSIKLAQEATPWRRGFFYGKNKSDKPLGG